MKNHITFMIVWILGMVMCMVTFYVSGFDFTGLAIIGAVCITVLMSMLFDYYYNEVRGDGSVYYKIYRVVIVPNNFGPKEKVYSYYFKEKPTRKDLVNILADFNVYSARKQAIIESIEEKGYYLDPTLMYGAFSVFVDKVEFNKQSYIHIEL